MGWQLFHYYPYWFKITLLTFPGAIIGWFIKKDNILSGVILSADCCDIYNPKVVRGSMGAVFRVPFHICEGIPAFLSQYNGLCSYAAVVDRDAEKISEISFREPCVTVIGNEGNGLTKETIAACDHRVTIPMKGKAESLNASAAATVIIWEMLR